MQFDWHALLPEKKKKKKLARALSPSGVGGDSDIYDYVVTRERRLRLLSIQALICF